MTDNQNSPDSRPDSWVSRDHESSRGANDPWSGTPHASGNGSPWGTGGSSAGKSQQWGGSAWGTASQPSTPPGPQRDDRSSAVPATTTKGTKRGPGRTVAGGLLALLLAIGAGGAAGWYVANETPQVSQSSSAPALGNSDGKPAAPVSTKDWTSTAKKVTDSVVSIQVQTTNGGGQGSGVIVDDKGHIVTNNHVVAGASRSGSISVAMGNLAYDASVVGTDPSSDLAVLKLNTVPKGLKPIQFADSGKLVVGQGVMAIGNPLGLSGSVTTGVISALNRPVTTSGEREGVIRNTDVVVTNAIQTSAPINPGNSGGALVDSEGRLIGINSSIASLSSSEDGNTSGSIGIGFAIPANQVKNIADQLISNGKARHALLGLSASDAQAEKSDGSKMMGALVRTVTPGGVADKAGIKKNDLIVAVNGTTVGSSTSLVARVREQPVGSTVKIKILRDGKDQEVTATLRDAKR